MRDLFNTNPYGRYDMGRFSAPAFARQVKMGCELHTGYTEEDHTEEIDPKTMACKKCAKKHRASGRLAGAVRATPRLGDDLLDSAKSIFDGLLSTFGELVKDLPPQAAGAYQNRLKACQDMVGATPTTGSYIAAAACLRSLYDDMKNGKGLTPPTTMLPQQQPSSFPIVPVAIAAVGGLALIYVFTTMKKKPGKK
jgi:hypothetical protein